MGAPFLRPPTVGEAARNLVRAAEALQAQRDHADRIVAELEARWAINRAAAGKHYSKGGNTE
jgi:hypothetical protein